MQSGNLRTDGNDRWGYRISSCPAFEHDVRLSTIRLMISGGLEMRRHSRCNRIA